MFIKKWKKNLVDLDAKLSESRSGSRREVTADSINIDELMPKFIENMRRHHEQVEPEADLEANTSTGQPSSIEVGLLAKLKTGTDPNDMNNPFCTYSAYNEFFGIKPGGSTVEEPILEEDENLGDEYGLDFNVLMEWLFVISIKREIQTNIENPLNLFKHY